MAWKQGPLPPGTYYWGGVVPVGEEKSYGGFYFADFHGDHVLLPMLTDEKGDQRRLEADQVAWYDNSLELAPTGKGRQGS